MSGNLPSLHEIFSEVKDFRHPQGRRYKLQAVLVLTCLAMMHGAQTEEAIAKWSENQGRRWLQLLGIRRRRGPSQATIQRIFKGIDRTQLESVMSQWSKEILNAADPSAIATKDAIDHDEILSDEHKDTLSALNDWVGFVMNQLPVIDQDLELEKRDSLFESLALIGGTDSGPQHISEAGLKIWGVDYEHFNKQNVDNVVC